jgi:hypothetical protein
VGQTPAHLFHVIDLADDIAGGTEKSMPPDGRMDARADVNAAGLVIYETMTGFPAERFYYPNRFALKIPPPLDKAALLRRHPEEGPFAEAKAAERRRTLKLHLVANLPRPRKLLDLMCELPFCTV